MESFSARSTRQRGQPRICARACCTQAGAQLRAWGVDALDALLEEVRPSRLGELGFLSHLPWAALVDTQVGRRACLHALGGSGLGASAPQCAPL